MKRHLIGALAIFLLVIFSWAQETKAPFDLKKSQEELEIMKGILRTTISFVTQSSQKQSAYIFRSSEISAFYLSGQGAVFVIPASSSLISSFASPFVRMELSQQVQALKAQSELAALQANELAYRTWLGSGTGKGSASGSGSATAKAVDAIEAAPPAPPAPPEPPQVDREALRKKVEEYQAQAKKRREETEANRGKYLQNLAEVKTYLVETLANYGDSLTIVKPSEYITLVLTGAYSDGDAVYYGTNRQQTRYDVISAQKSWITDHKAGRLGLDAFKQKVLQYTQ